MTLAIGPVNSAGQADSWARAVDRFSAYDAFSFSHANLPGRRGWSFPATRHLPHHRVTPDAVKSVMLRRLLRGVSHVAIDSFASLYHRLDASHVGAEIDRLRTDFPQSAFALVAHGSDLRDPRRHMDRLEESYYRLDPEWTASLGEVAARNRATVRESGLPLFVSTPDLLLEDVTATWLPVVVDPARFAGAPPPFSRDHVRVLHLPSRRVPPIKGTDLIEPVLRELHAKGEIEFVAPQRVDPAQMPALIASCDMVVEQARSGYYSAHAVEAMAAGRVVIGSLADDVAAVMPEVPPIWRAGSGRVEHVITTALKDRGTARDLAAIGPGFVSRWHDGRMSARVLRGWLDSNAPQGGSGPSSMA